jgi:hypothetical protein
LDLARHSGSILPVMWSMVAREGPANKLWYFRETLQAKFVGRNIGETGPAFTKERSCWSNSGRVQLPTVFYQLLLFVSHLPSYTLKLPLCYFNQKGRFHAIACQIDTFCHNGGAADCLDPSRFR